MANRFRFLAQFARQCGLRGVGLLLLAGGLWLSDTTLNPLALWRQRQIYLPASFDSAAPEFARTGEERHILLFAKTNGYRKHAAIAAGRRALEQIAADNFWFVYITDNAAVFNKNTLPSFDSVVFNNVSGPLFTGAQQEAFDAFVRAGGGVHHLDSQPDGAAYRRRLAGQIRTANPCCVK